MLTRAYARWELVARADSPHGYVRRMLVNEYVSWRRKWARIVPFAQLDDLVPEAADHAEAHARSVELVGLLRGLPPKQRAAVVLRYYADQSDDEIAETLGCTTSTVRSNIARALASLRVQHTSTHVEIR